MNANGAPETHRKACIERPSSAMTFKCRATATKRRMTTLYTVAYVESGIVLVTEQEGMQFSPSVEKLLSQTAEYTVFVI